MRNSNQMSLEMELSPAEWMAICRGHIKKAREAGADTTILEGQQKQAFDYFKKKHQTGRG